MNFSLMEKKALIGLAGIAIFVGYSIWEIGQRNFWFEIKNTYFTTVKNAEGLRIGGGVSISGLRVGEIVAMDVDEHNQIRITLEIRRNMSAKIRQNAEVSFVRTFVIGEKRIDISPGSDTFPALSEGSSLPAKESSDIAEFISGRKLAELLAQLESLISGLNQMTGGLNTVVQKYESGQFNRMLALAEPTLENLSKISADALVITQDLRQKSTLLPAFIENGNRVFTGVNNDLLKNHVMRDTFAGAKRDMFDSGLFKQTLQSVDNVMRPTTKMVATFAEKEQLFRELLGNLENLSQDLKEKPRYGKQILVMIEELTITLKALQKTWLLEDKADAIRSRQAPHTSGSSKSDSEPKDSPTSSEPIAE